MKIWLVTSGEYSGRSNEAAFSSEKKALKFRADLAKKNRDNWPNDLEEFVLDEMIGSALRTVHVVTVRMSTGDAARQRPDTLFVSPGWSSTARSIDEYIWGRSAIGPGHALKVAVEHRQKLLRSNAEKKR